MMNNSSRIALLVTVALLSSASFGATISLNDLSSQTVTFNKTATGTIGSVRYSDNIVGDGDIDTSSAVDVTFAWEMTLLKTTQDGSTRRTFLEVGGGNGTGLSVTWYGDTIYAQVEQGTSRLGGNGAGNTAALSYTLAAGDLNVERTWVVSVDLDATSPTMTFFVDDTLIGSVSASVSLTDWAGTNDGGFWNSIVGGNSVLLETFGNGTGAVRPGSTEGTVNTTTGLRIYEDTFVNIVPEPATMSLLALGGMALFKRRRK